MKTRRALAGLFTGTLFGVGLAVSQMANPEKVLSFLRLVPGWDPSLLLVMGGAVAVTFVGFRLVTRRAPLFDTRHHLPGNRIIDVRLLAGAVIFGLGWGLAGYCPGPALAGLASGSSEPVLFVLAMLAGSQLGRLTER